MSELPRERAVPDLGALEAITDAVQAGAGLPAVVRAASRVLGASLALIDATSAVLAVEGSSADERALLGGTGAVERVDLRVAESSVGELRLRVRGGGAPDPTMLRLVTTIVAAEVERVRAPARASHEAAVDFLRDVIERRVGDAETLVARGRELGIDLGHGGCIVVARAHSLAPAEGDWRPRLLELAERAGRSTAAGSIAAPLDQNGATLVLMVSDPDGESGRRVADAVLRELRTGLSGFSFALGRSRRAADPRDLPRASKEALLAANVAEGDPDNELLAYDDTGTYRLLLPYMDDPAELQRFYDETVRPIVAYDDQYETELLGTLETYLECDANVNATKDRLFTHRHTVRYRLERIRDLCGLDINSTDGREKLSTGLKAMRVLGLAAPRGPASEAGAGAGRVRRTGDGRPPRS